MESGKDYLLKNLSDSIFEMMLKLDEQHNSSMCIYYTQELAAFLLGCKKEELPEKLNEFKTYAEKKLGRVDVETASDNRYGIRVYSNGIDIIMESNPRRFFLRQLIDTIRGRNCTLEQIKEIFAAESQDYVCEEIDDSEFQYVVYFKDENIDEYKYCFTFDVMGSYYHRLIDYDFDTIVHASHEGHLH
ncbi:MAG: hypothetical protein EGQ35_03630 [Clostridiales bacterium]|nr:hypothetical protein [Clostridiales bacterium]